MSAAVHQSSAKIFLPFWATGPLNPSDRKLQHISAAESDWLQLSF